MGSYGFGVLGECRGRYDGLGLVAVLLESWAYFSFLSFFSLAGVTCFWIWVCSDLLLRSYLSAGMIRLYSFGDGGAVLASEKPASFSDHVPVQMDAHDN